MLMKAQISLELLITVGMVVIFTVPVVLLLLSFSQSGIENISYSKAEANAKILADSITEVSIQGEGAKRTVYLDLPQNLYVLTVRDNEVTLMLETSSGPYDAVAPYSGIAKTGPDSSGIYDRRGITAVVVEVGSSDTVEVRVA